VRVRPGSDEKIRAIRFRTTSLTGSAGFSSRFWKGLGIHRRDAETPSFSDRW
jgi:hypothetical protein